MTLCTCHLHFFNFAGPTFRFLFAFPDKNKPDTPRDTDHVSPSWGVGYDDGDDDTYMTPEAVPADNRAGFPQRTIKNDKERRLTGVKAVQGITGAVDVIPAAPDDRHIVVADSSVPVALEWRQMELRVIPLRQRQLHPAVRHCKIVITASFSQLHMQAPFCKRTQTHLNFQQQRVTRDQILSPSRRHFVLHQRRKCFAQTPVFNTCTSMGRFVA